MKPKPKPKPPITLKITDKVRAAGTYRSTITAPKQPFADIAAMKEHIMVVLQRIVSPFVIEDVEITVSKGSIIKDVEIDRG